MTSLVEEARLDAKAFRENTVYDSEGDPIRLIANADRLDQYADTIEALCEALTRIRNATNRGAWSWENTPQRCEQKLNRANDIARAALAKVQL